jgi:hypothetical protein
MKKAALGGKEYRLYDRQQPHRRHHVLVLQRFVQAHQGAIETLHWHF